jgi:Flp pilus assembly protein TadD
MYRNVALAAALLTTLHASARADDVIDATYGKGVHCYFAGRHVEAHEYLTQSIGAGSRDPRCYYFRGLNYLKLGREPEAKMDFAQGAKLEMADTTRFYNVSKALERCQGRARALLERFRTDARLAAHRRQELIRYERYERIRRVEPDITVPAVPSDAAPSEDANPPPKLDEQPPAEEMPAENEAAEEMPAEDEAAEEMPAEDEAAEEMPVEEPAPEDEDMPAEEDPFSEE